MSQVKQKYFALKGGIHLDVPAIAADPGWARSAYNYQLDREGNYLSNAGHERFDGRKKPSDASYHILGFISGNAEMSTGDSVSGDLSSATGILIDQILESGSYAGGDAAGYLVLDSVTGSFVTGEDLVVSAVVEAVSYGELDDRTVSDALASEYLVASQTYFRSLITTVPGSGNILGVIKFGGTVYAFRNNAGGTAAAIYESSTSGWSLVDLGRRLSFTSGGTTEIVEGNTITGATSGATAYVERVVLTSGTWAGGDAAGYFILSTQVGTFRSENLNVDVNPNLATISGNSTTQTLVAGGRYEFVTHNFGGHTKTKRLYWCDGKNPAFEFDGTVLVPIFTGMTEDTPEHIAVHKNKLFLSFSGGSLQHSSDNNPPSVVAPYIWSVVTGSGEIGVGDEITGLFKLPGDILCIKTRNSTQLLYGSAASGDDAWVLKVHDYSSGAIEWSGQLIENDLVVCDDRGITSLKSTDVYGDFASSALSKDIEPHLRPYLQYVNCSVSLKNKSQYRVFFDGGQAVFMTVYRGKLIGFTTVLYNVNPVCMSVSENQSGEEEIFFGGADGYVYQDESGESFDGSNINSYVFFHYNHLGSPGRKKKVHKIDLEMDNPDNAPITSRIYWDYALHGYAEYSEIYMQTQGSASVDGEQEVGTGIISVGETGSNFSMRFYTSAKNYAQHTLQGAIIHYSLRGRKFD